MQRIKENIVKSIVSCTHIVRVVLSLQHNELIDRICQKLGQSETLRIAFLQYAEKLRLITGKVPS